MLMMSAHHSPGLLSSPWRLLNQSGAQLHHVIALAVHGLFSQHVRCLGTAKRALLWEVKSGDRETILNALLLEMIAPAGIEPSCVPAAPGHRTTSSS